jgi:hypothetical protein
MLMAEIVFGYFLLAIVLDHAHLACPIWLGWGNRSFRRVMLERPEKFILLPALCIIGALLIGEHAATTHDLSFRVLAGAYLVWNAWHFGSQHFGIASLAGWRLGPRWMRQVVFIVPTMGLMLIPMAFSMGVLPIIVISECNNLIHWVTDIGLTAYVKRRWLWVFLPTVLVAGIGGFLWKTVTVDPYFCGSLPACTAAWGIPMLVSIRYGLGFWHFLMSRWVWKLSDPQVRATIDRDLFSAPL